MKHQQTGSGGRRRPENGAALTVTAFQAQASRDSVHHGEANDVAAVILDEALEVLDLLSYRAPYVALPLGIHVHVWPPDTET